MNGRKGVANEGLHELDGALVDLRSELQFKVQKERQFIYREIRATAVSEL